MNKLQHRHIIFLSALLVLGLPSCLSQKSIVESLRISSAAIKSQQGH